MLTKIFPRAHARYSSLRVLGPYLAGFTEWLSAQGYPRVPIRVRVRATARLDARLRRRGVHGPGDLTAAQWLALASRESQRDIALATAIRSLVRYFDSRGLVCKPRPATRSEQLVAQYRNQLSRTRGLADSTVVQHCDTAARFLAFAGFDRRPASLRRIDQKLLDGFVRKFGKSVGRGNLQHKAAQLRSFLRFLASRGEVAPGLDSCIDTPRLYRGELLPCALPWETVQAFLAAIDRTTPKGCRDYAMFVLIATYGLRISEVAELKLEDIEWRASRLRVPRPKASAPLMLPLTEEVGAALLDYLQRARPKLPCRQIFLRVRAPAGPIKRTAVIDAFVAWARHAPTPIVTQRPHALRHSLAVHLLRQGTSLKAIGDVLGHRSIESTCVYLRLHVADLRDAALDLPREVHS
jgi:integrase/recombinase XerD